MKRRTFLKALAAGTLAAPAAASAAVPRSRPNILIIVTDDQGYADLSAYSHAAEDVRTPQMDRLASEGVLLTQAYVSAPVCSPSRAGWNTGLYQQRWGHVSWGAPLPGGARTLAEYLKAAGYVTGKVGKSDFGAHYHRQDTREYPLNHGYDQFLGFSSHAHDYWLLSEEIEKHTPDPHGSSAALGPLFENRGRREYDEGYLTTIFTDSAIDFLQRHRSEPFFLTVAYNSVHHLIHEVPESYLRRFGVKPIPNYDPATMGKYRTYYNTYNELGPIGDDQMRRYYLANLACLDDQVGRLLDSLDNLGLAENTLVLFFADNGGSPLTGANNRPLRGSKYILFEGGIRVPMMARWPGRLPAGKTYPHRVSTLDILPTCLEASGVALPADTRLDGSSALAALASGQPAPSSSRPLFWRFGKHWAVREGDWKLVHTADYTHRKPTSQIRQGPRTGMARRLFNLKTDPAEQKDVSDGHPDVVRRLQRLYDEWAKDCQGDPRFSGKRNR